jgi:hypothetical protein
MADLFKEEHHKKDHPKDHLQNRQEKVERLERHSGAEQVSYFSCLDVGHTLVLKNFSLFCDLGSGLRGLPKKEGGGGKYTWGALVDQEPASPALDERDPNFAEVNLNDIFFSFFSFLFF